jgi:hypothetical protein
MFDEITVTTGNIDISNVQNENIKVILQNV